MQGAPFFGGLLLLLLQIKCFVSCGEVEIGRAAKRLARLFQRQHPTKLHGTRTNHRTISMMVPTAIAMYVCLKDFMCLTLALSVNCYCVGSRVRACYILICRARSGLGWAGWGCDCGVVWAGLSES